jgi:hypothetical protein
MDDLHEQCYLLHENLKVMLLLGLIGLRERVL